ncbi:MAG: HAMP domain-containing sensor histidine kinase [Candidatus Zixiibacteriota bacterium]
MNLRGNISQRTTRLYIGKSTVFKVFLLVGVVVISAVFVWYTVTVIHRLQKDTRTQVEKYVKMWQLVANAQTSGFELQFIFDEIIVKATFPIIVLDGNREPIHWRNISGIDPGDTTVQSRQRLKRLAEKMVRQNGEFPLRFGEAHANYFCYGDSDLIRLLTWMPAVEIGIVVAFLIVALIGFQNIRRSEERHIWVGMAKETAHQLGTPISSLLGWSEVLESQCASDRAGVSREDIEEIAKNTRVDIERLQKIATRFSQIGSKPDLHPCDLNQVVLDTVEYYRRRLPFEGKGIAIEFSPGDLPLVKVNPELLGWALENLVKNALQAVDSKNGRVDINTEVSGGGRGALIVVRDNGPGISSPAARKIFRPGFSTKKRGWGLGLTLVKRIVEISHAGRVTLKRSRPGETVFEILLPIEGREEG